MLKQSITDIVSLAHTEHKVQVEDNMDVLMNDIIQQDLIHQAFFGTSYINDAVTKAMKKRGLLTEERK
jgi:hypothetical protein